MSWPVVELGSLATIKGGGTPDKKNPDFWEGEIPWASVKDFKSSAINETQDYITQEGLDNSATNLIPKGTIVVPTRMALGKVAITGQNMAINQDIKALSINDSEQLDISFLFRFLESQSSFIESQGQGATVKGIKLDFLKSIKVPLPPLVEQRRVAAILDKADHIRQKRQQAIEMADQFLRSVFLDMFGDPVTNSKGWNVIEISTVCTDIVDCVNRTAPAVEQITPYRMVRTTNVRNHRLNLDSVRYVEKDVYEKWTRRLKPELGDIIFTREAPAGEAGVVETEDLIFLGQRTMHFRPDMEKVNSTYLLYELMSAGVKDQIRKLSTGSTVTHLSVPECKRFKVRVPPVQLQNEFSYIASKLNRVKNSYEEGSTSPLFESLSQELFSA